MFQESGFTLMEVVVSLLVLSFITLVVVQVYNGSIFAIRSSAKKMDAVYEVQSTLEANKTECNSATLKIPFIISEAEEKTVEVGGCLHKEQVSAAKHGISAQLFLPQHVEDAVQ